MLEELHSRGFLFLWDLTLDEEVSDKPPGLRPLSRNWGVAVEPLRYPLDYELWQLLLVVGEFVESTSRDLLEDPHVRRHRRKPEFHERPGHERYSAWHG